MSRAPGLADPSPLKPDPPVAGRRIATLDILRGLALLGMVLAHCHKMLAATPASPGENPIGWLITLAVAEKDRAIFAFLFGVSFAVMMRRIEARGLPVVPIFLRRLCVLYLIGCAAEALTRFTILREYAWWGIPLLFLRHQPTRTLLVVALICATAMSIRDIADTGYMIARTGLAETKTVQDARQQAWEETLAARAAAQNGPDYSAVIASRTETMLSDIVSVYRFTPNLYLALFILGLLAMRHGVFDAPLRHRRLLVGSIIAGLVCWAVAHAVLSQVPPEFIAPRLAFRLRAGLGLVDEQFLAFAYIGAVTLLLAYRPALAAGFSPLAWVGKMALTNYLLHIALIEFACASYGLNLRLKPWEELLVAILLFVGLAGLSRFWLTRFRYGPVEWAWRSLTYWQPQPLRLAKTTGE